MMRMGPSARARLGLAVVCGGALVGPFDMTVNTAFPVITEAFSLAPRDIQWVVIAYVLAQSAFAMVFGHLGDRLGHRRIFALGLAASALAHAAVALSQSYPMLVAMRALQGMAVGIVLACAPALATLMFPPERKARVIAVYAAVASLGMALAPWLGGLLLQAFGWPGVYWFRVPLSLMALAALALIPTLTPQAPQVAPTHRGGAFDWGGAIGLSLVLAFLILGLAGHARPDSTPYATPFLALGLIGTLVFVRHESRATRPVLRMAPFRSVRFSGLQAASVAVNLACFANLLVLPYVITAGMGASITTAGLMLSAYPAGSVVGSLVSERIASGWAPVRAMGAGLALAALGLCATALTLALLPPSWVLVGGMLASGLGQGLFNVGYMDETTTLLPVEERGVAGSLVTVTRLLGVLLGATGISRLLEVTGDPGRTFGWLGGGLLLFAVLFLRLTGPAEPGARPARLR